MLLTTGIEEFPSASLRTLREKARYISLEVSAPLAEKVDRECMWPEHTMKALAKEGLLGLHVPERLGGLGQGLQGLVAVTELLGQSCSSSAMCFGMHSVGSAVIAAKATKEQETRYLVPIAAGKHITTLALSESGSGIYFYLPGTELRVVGGEWNLFGTKQFVTNAGHADSYVVSCVGAASQLSAGEFSCAVVEGHQAGVEVKGAWEGLGMRGNSSRSISLNGAPLSPVQLLGATGDQIWYVFEVVAPYFLTAMAGTYLGIAQAALDIAIEHVKGRSYSAIGESLADAPVVQLQIADMWGKVEQARQLVYRAARLGDAGDTTGLATILMSKAVAGTAAVDVCNEAMSLCGGMGYRENGKLSRLLRDSRASHVMTPTTNLLKLWAGKALLGVPLL